VLARIVQNIPLTRYHGVFAAHSRYRAQITPAGRGTSPRNADAPARTLSEHVALTWMQRLKRVFAIDIERCGRCGARLQVIASIEPPELIERILAHLDRSASPSAARPAADDATALNAAARLRRRRLSTPIRGGRNAPVLSLTPDRGHFR
jgi:hypothetical protein